MLLDGHPLPTGIVLDLSPCGIERLADDQFQILSHTLDVERLHPFLLGQVFDGRVQIRGAAHDNLLVWNHNLEPNAEPIPCPMMPMRDADNGVARFDVPIVRLELRRVLSDLFFDPLSGRQPAKGYCHVCFHQSHLSPLIRPETSLHETEGPNTRPMTIAITMASTQPSPHTARALAVVG